MSLQVIGAGFGRTGTLSLKSSLEQLGFGPCYHMYELLGHIDHAPAWLAGNNGDASALRAPLAGYGATVDWPGCVLWRELADLYPDAKVVLSVRPPQRWYDSFRQTVGAVIAQERDPNMPEAFWPVFDVSDLIVRDRSFGAGFDLDDQERVIAAYEAHNAAVRAGVAPERLLEFDVTEGWAPLCAFLGVPVPAGEFPNVNDRDQFRQLFGLEDESPESPENSDAVIAEMQERFQHVVEEQRS